MDHGGFDALTRAVASTAETRRGVLRLLAGGALAGAVGTLGSGDVAAKPKRRKKRRGSLSCPRNLPVRCSPTAEEPRAICYPRGAVCCGSALGGGACPPGEDCCPPNPLSPTGSCAPPGAHCCPAWAGGGYCGQVTPVCCPPTPQDPFGLCIPTGNQCCSAAEGGGYCRDDETCCPPSPGFPNGSCAPPGFGCWALTAASDRSGVHRPRSMEPPPGSEARG